MTIVRIRKAVSAVVRLIAYLSTTMQWFWIAVLLLPDLLRSDFFTSLNEPSTSAPVIRFEPVEVSGFGLWLIGGITIAMVALTIYIVYKAPKNILHGSDAIVRESARVSLPLITHHSKLSERKRQSLSKKLILVIQLALSIIPGVLSMFIPAMGEISRDIIVIIALTLMIISCLAFGVAWALEPKAATSRTRSHASRGLRSL